MANEISIGASIFFSKGGASAQRADSISVTVTGDAFTHEVQEVGTTREELIQGALLDTPGYVFIKNLDATNYVEIGSSNSDVYTIKLKAKEFALYRHSGTTIYGRANDTACNVEYLIIED